MSCWLLAALLGLGAAIIGGIIGYLLGNRRAKHYELGWENRNKEYENLQGEYSASLASKAETDELNVKLNAELGAEHNRVKGLNTALSEEVEFRKKLQADVDAHLGEIGKLKASLEAKDAEFVAARGLDAKQDANLEAQIANLKALLDDKDAALKAGEEKLNFAASASQVALEELEAKIKDSDAKYQAQIEALNAELSEKNDAIKGFEVKLGNLEASEKALNNEVESLKVELEDASASVSSRGVGGGLVMGTSSENVSADDLAKIKASIGAIPFGSIGGPAAIGDDLTKVNNITAAEEMKLNAARINTYIQLARLQDNELEAVASATGLDVNKMKDEDWVGQARQLLFAAVANQDDLTKIEGIGPKISSVFNNNGIFTFAELANTAVGVLKHILKEGGPRFRLADPGTWPMQARLAADGEWAQLKVLQDVLDGGKFKNKA
jgi:predicted flap endonuclease-1-like 5' DNA nuclease/predicted nuclease with TOPRIM domain